MTFQSWKNMLTQNGRQNKVNANLREKKVSKLINNQAHAI
jgi:hypothetical protein